MNKDLRERAEKLLRDGADPKPTPVADAVKAFQQELDQRPKETDTLNDRLQAEEQRQRTKAAYDSAIESIGNLRGLYEADR